MARLWQWAERGSNLGFYQANTGTQMFRVALCINVNLSTDVQIHKMWFIHTMGILLGKKAMLTCYNMYAS